MSDPQPRLLILDPDRDFLESMERSASSRGVACTVQHYATRDATLDLEELILRIYPDIVVVNLDQQDGSDFARPVAQIHDIPLGMPPLILATTAREGVDLKQRAYASGVDDYLLRPFTPVEIWLRLEVLMKTRRLQKQFDAATRKLSTLNQQLSESNLRLEEITITDELTGLSNMRQMTLFMEKHFIMLKRYGRPFSLMMIDLDRFKQVNDENDHLVGSATIRAVGQLIDRTMRTTDVKARYGGDEYIIAMPETDLPGAMLVAERLRAAVEGSVFHGNSGNEFGITTSIGVTGFDANRHASYSDIIKDADRAMYQAKSSGRNRVIQYDPASQAEGYDETQSAVLGSLKKAKRQKA